MNTTKKKIRFLVILSILPISTIIYFSIAHFIVAHNSFLYGFCQEISYSRKEICVLSFSSFNTRDTTNLLPFSHVFRAVTSSVVSRPDSQVTKVIDGSVTCATSVGYRFRFFDRNGKLVDQGIALQQFQPFQFVNSYEVTAVHGLDVVHFDFVGGCVPKNQVVINQVKNPIVTGMFE